MVQREDIYDAAVVGAGVVGLAAALALAKAGRRVALVEPAPPEPRPGALGADLRSLALNAASRHLLQGLGVAWPDCARSQTDALDHPTPVRAMRVWEHDGGAALCFHRRGTPLAWVAENSVLATALWRLAADRVALVRHQATGLAQAPDAATLRLADGDALRARLVVAADGAASLVRRGTATDVRLEPPLSAGGQLALGTVARLAEPHGCIAWQRFGASGPLALLPLRERHLVSIIWSGALAQQERLLAASDDAFRAALQDATEGCAGAVREVDRRLAFPVRQAVAETVYPWPRVLLAGDAARTLHPLAGQGVNIGLEDARRIGAEAAVGGDLGAPGRWRAYARARRRRSKLMVAAMRGLLEAYCGAWTTGPWLRWARNATLRRIDGSAALKNQLMREAMGLGALAA